ncbi:hypothetical protein Ciccas_010517 [Cichlidogyrus casuarinus]|uniref:Adenosine kinase n=1 Tax=Cichlidogyrus casuarinus TaxID=1844966 RepID=A0ABD2PVJ1_9PLAT
MTVGASDSNPIFLGIGNPLLDLSITVTDQSLHEKYGLKTDDAILANDSQMALYDDVLNHPSVQLITGGATLNSMKMIQWLSKKPGTASFFGAIGTDKFGQKLKSTCDEVGLKTVFQECPDFDTGKCAVLIKEHERSLVTHLGAAQQFRLKNMTDEMWEIAKNASIFYIAVSFSLYSDRSLILFAPLKSLISIWGLDIYEPQQILA